VRAYVEIFIESGRDLLISAAYIRQIDGVRESYAVSTHCDIMAVVEAENFAEVNLLVLHRIKVIRGISRIKILPCIDFEVEESAGKVINLPML